jgi:hypothetical protein
MTDRKTPNCFENNLFQCCFSVYHRYDVHCHAIRPVRSILRTVRDFIMEASKRRQNLSFVMKMARVSLARSV